MRPAVMVLAGVGGVELTKVGGMELAKVGGMELAVELEVEVTLESEGPAAQAIISGVWPSVLREALARDSWAWRRRKSYFAHRSATWSELALGRRGTGFKVRTWMLLNNERMWL